MFLHSFVSYSVHGGGGGSIPTYIWVEGVYPSMYWARCVDRGVCCGVCVGGVCVDRWVWMGVCPLAPPMMATEAVGTHPTGTHTCSKELTTLVSNTLYLTGNTSSPSQVLSDTKSLSQISTLLYSLQINPWQPELAESLQTLKSNVLHLKSEI